MDFVVETGGKLVPIEVKLSATPRPAMASAIKTFRKDLGDKALAGYVVHPGDVILPLGPGVPNPALGDEWFNTDLSGGGKWEKHTGTEWKKT